MKEEKKIAEEILNDVKVVSEEIKKNNDVKIDICGDVENNTQNKAYQTKNQNNETATNIKLGSKNETNKQNKFLPNQMFGKILVNFRKNNHDVEYAILSQATNVELVGNTLKISIVGNSMWSKIANDQHCIDLMNEIISDYGAKVSIFNATKDEENKIDVLKFLKENFEKYLKIKMS